MSMTLPIALVHGLQVACSAEVVHVRRLGGGCIHEVRRVHFADGRGCCLKYQPESEPDYLAAEADGLAALAPHIRVPVVLARGRDGGCRWLAMEWLDLHPYSPASLLALGEALAKLHLVTRDAFGHPAPNFLGRTPLDNSPCPAWPEFFLSRRLEPMLRLLRDRGHVLQDKNILKAAGQRLDGHAPPASLLHGDLWTGNTASLPDGTPVVFDPAVYAGDAETDLAMLELFGGRLPAAFFGRYQAVRLLSDGREDRRPVYDLLHALNHLLLFGPSYLPMVDHCLDRLGL